ncbi:hypothetical protein BV25DRAFT_1819295 [Artomyces pyxidatus]|uniref:Uncharacterized protein n=1 Tax=Artomyces pyxidatus TaxID=48021 RepID=A0ACB8THC5_9AGAM|nr:hypothetical protein BV25DRAFT_1819295 [Artomyces pyxidatus]
MERDQMANNYRLRASPGKRLIASAVLGPWACLRAPCLALGLRRTFFAASPSSFPQRIASVAAIDVSLTSCKIRGLAYGRAHGTVSNLVRTVPLDVFSTPEDKGSAASFAELGSIAVWVGGMMASVSAYVLALCSCSVHFF